jgi:NitT/TauT family transport system permease protein
MASLDTAPATTPAPAARKAKRVPIFGSRAATERALPWIVVIGLFLVWEAACVIFDIPDFILPSPIEVAQSFWRWRGPILNEAAQTLFTTLVGFSIAVVFGLALGVAIGSSTLVYNGLYPVLIGFNAIPKVAVVPILMIWFGIGTIPAIITAFMISFFPIVVNVATGIATVEPELRDVMRALGAKGRDIVLKVGLPRAMPYFFASLKVAMPVAFVGSILAETIGSNHGIGKLMVTASSRFDVPLVFAGLMVTAVMGVMMYVVSEWFEKRMTGWATRGMNQQTTAGA